LINGVVAKYERLDIMFNNAGMNNLTQIPIYNLDDQAYKNMMNTNMDGMFYGTKYACKVMKTQQSGSIILNGSVLGLGGQRNTSAYCISKAGTINLAKAAALDMTEFNVRVNCICPGVVLTANTEAAANSNDYIKNILMNFHPKQGLGIPLVEVCNALVYLASDESTWVTGTTLTIDGGYTAK